MTKPDNRYRFSITIPVRFSDLDALGHVNNARFLTYMEEARLAYWTHLFPLDPENIKSLGLILADAKLSFRSPATLGETLRVWTRVASFGTKSFVQEYRIETLGSQRLIVEGSTVVVMFEYHNNRSIAIPGDVKETITGFETEQPSDRG